MNNDKVINSIDRLLEYTSKLSLMKGNPRMLTPPRPGLQWNEANHRWIRPKFANDFDKHLAEVRYVKPSEGRLRLRMTGMRLYNLFRRQGFEGLARDMAKEMDALLKDKNANDDQTKVRFIQIANKYKGKVAEARM